MPLETSDAYASLWLSCLSAAMSSAAQGYRASLSHSNPIIPQIPWPSESTADALRAGAERLRFILLRRVKKLEQSLSRDATHNILSRGITETVQAIISAENTLKADCSEDDPSHPASRSPAKAGFTFPEGLFNQKKGRRVVTSDASTFTGDDEVAGNAPYALNTVASVVEQRQSSADDATSMYFQPLPDAELRHLALSCRGRLLHAVRDRGSLFARGQRQLAAIDVIVQVTEQHLYVREVTAADEINLFPLAEVEELSVGLDAETAHLLMQEHADKGNAEELHSMFRRTLGISFRGEPRRIRATQSWAKVIMLQFQTCDEFNAVLVATLAPPFLGPQRIVPHVTFAVPKWAFDESSTSVSSSALSQNQDVLRRLKPAEVELCRRLHLVPVEYVQFKKRLCVPFSPPVVEVHDVASAVPSWDRHRVWSVLLFLMNRRLIDVAVLFRAI